MRARRGRLSRSLRRRCSENDELCIKVMNFVFKMMILKVLSSERDDGVERRIDPSDGVGYSYTSFEEVYVRTETETESIILNTKLIIVNTIFTILNA